MITHFPEELLLEVIKLLSSDIQTLSSYALTSYALAQRCRPYIFRRVNLDEATKPGLRYNKLRDVLEKSPSCADYTHELDLYIRLVKSEAENYDGFVNISDPGLPQVLSLFNQLKQVHISS